MSREAYSPPDPGLWVTATLRFLFFTVEPQNKERREWWREFTGTEPDETSRRKEQVEEAGLLDPNHRLAVAVDPFKIAWLVAPVVDNFTDVVDKPPLLGPFGDEAEKFLDAVEKWLPKAPLIKRVAFSGTLLYPAATHDDGYLLLNRFLETVDVDPQSSDFVYRVNRKTSSKLGAEGLLVNQLMTWAAQKMAAKVVVQTETPEQAVVSEHYFALLELDVNTDHARTAALQPSDLPALCRELVAHATTRTVKGDTRI